MIYTRRHFDTPLVCFSVESGADAPGWHLQFVDAARRHGGRVVNFSLKQGVLSICHASEFRIVLQDVLNELDLDRDGCDDLRKAEAER